MAEYIVSLVIEKLASQLLETLSVSSHSTVRGQVEWIQGELRRILCFLKDADAKQDGDERVRNWVADIRDVAYDTEDAIDSYVLRIRRGKEKREFMLFERYPFDFNDMIARYKLNKQISRIKTRIYDISNSRSIYGIQNIGKGGEGTTCAGNSLCEKRRSDPQYFEDDTVGLENDMRILEDRIIRGELRLSVVSIIGMAGLGKTTLAKKIYRSSDVKQYFDCCAWIYVSQEYRGRDVLRNLCRKVMGLSKVDLEKMHKEELGEELSKFLGERRYFIVFDDIWRIEVWDDLKSVFPDRNNGSRFLFTTRFRDVALHADPRSSPYILNLLNGEDSWKLMSKKICLEWNGMKSLPTWAEELGRQIVKKCGGLPLAIVVLGGLLSRRKPIYGEWHKVLQSAHWQLMQDPTQCADILTLSYRDLPDYLKSCFLYFGLFPEDFEISCRRLIHLWVAEGFVQPRGQEPLEDVAEDYLEELVGRSMVQVATKKLNGRIKTVRLHDLLRELSITKAKEEQFLDVIHGDVNASLFMRPRRLSVNFGSPPTTGNTSRVRSLLFFDLSAPIVRDLKKLKMLRVLDLEGIYIAAIDSGIGNLIHLRYLGLRGTWLKQLPSSMAKLLNLQTLDLRSTLVDPIPVVIWKMKELKHLYFEIRETVMNPPPNMPLSNLETLQGIYIGKNCRLARGLDKWTNLRHLALYGHLIFQEETLRRWIFNSKALESLKLEAIGRSYEEIDIDSAIPRFLSFSNNILLSKLHVGGFIIRLFDVSDFPPNLSELSLNGSFLMEDPMGKLEKLPNLRVLKLKQSSYVGRQMVCSNGGFPQLQFLKLSFLSSVETWRIEEGALPNLRQLQIVECKRLKIVPRGLWPVTSLCQLKLGFMPHDFEVRVQERKGENWYRIEHVLPV